MQHVPAHKKVYRRLKCNFRKVCGYYLQNYCRNLNHTLFKMTGQQKAKSLEEMKLAKTKQKIFYLELIVKNRRLD